MIALYHTIFLKPTFNALVALYNLVGDVGVAIILLTLAVRLIILPVTLKSLKSQKALQELQPKLNALKEKHKGDKPGLAKATMELYKQEKVNPASSCLPLLIQLPIFIALYQAMQVVLKNDGFDFLYGFVSKPEQILPKPAYRSRYWPAPPSSGRQKCSRFKSRRSRPRAVKTKPCWG